MTPSKIRSRAAQADRPASPPKPQPPHTCLACLAEVELVPLRSTPTVAAHKHSHYPKLIVDCRGSGYGPARNDGRDDVRVKAINARREIMIDVAEKRESFAREMAKGWTMDLLISMNAEMIVRGETVAEIWQCLAESGDWWATLQKVMAELTQPHGGDNALGSAVSALKARGRRDWLTAVRTTLTRLAEKHEDGGDLLASLLYAL